MPVCLCDSAEICVSYRDVSHAWLGTHLTSALPSLNSFHLKVASFLGNPHSKVLGVDTSKCLLGGVGDLFQPRTLAYRQYSQLITSHPSKQSQLLSWFCLPCNRLLRMLLCKFQQYQPGNSGKLYVLYLGSLSPFFDIYLHIRFHRCLWLCLYWRLFS